LQHEWRATWERAADALHAAFELALPVVDGWDLPHGHTTRHAPGGQHDGFLLRPKLADRAMVVRPDVPFRVMAGRDIDVFVSTPLWLSIVLAPPRDPGRADAVGFGTGGEAGRELFELPVTRPSDTWFGPSTIEGELAYLSKTAARLDLADVPLRHGRAVTRIRVKNRTSESLTLERVLLPAPEMQLFMDASGRMWTQSMDVELSEAGTADIRFIAGAPAHAPGASTVGQPRRTATKHLLVRALSAFWA
jgi:hypothetical protein